MNPATDLVLRYLWYFVDVRKILFRYMTAWRDHALVLTLASNRIGRALMRLDRLVLRWRAGKLIQRPHKPRDPKPWTTPEVQLPTKKAWLVDLIQPTAILHSGLQAIFEDREMQALFAAAPKQAGRILRPMARMVGVPLPEALKLPKRKRKPRPKPEPKPKLPKLSVYAADNPAYAAFHVPNRLRTKWHKPAKRTI